MKGKMEVEFSLSEISKNLRERTKKVGLLLLIIPVVTGATATYLSSKQVHTFSNKSQIFISKNAYGNPMSDVEYLSTFIKSDKFLSTVIEKHNIGLSTSDIRGNLVIGSTPPYLVDITYTDVNSQKSKNVVKAITDEVLSKGNQWIEEKRNQIDNTLSNFNKINLATDTEPGKTIEMQSTLKQLKEDMENNSLFKDIEVVKVTKIPRGIQIFLGVVLGLLINVLIILAPELLMKRKNQT